MNIKDLIDKTLSLPVQERAYVVESILRSMNPPKEEIDKLWVNTARNRLKELRTGKSKSVPGEEVFKNIR